MNNIFVRCGCRIYQSIFYVASFLMNFREPKVVSGPGSVKKIPTILREKKITRVLLVTDQGLYKLQLHQPVVDALQEGGIEVSVFHDTVANPTITNIGDALKLYDQGKAEAVVAFGGGSAMDCAKGVAVRAANRRKSIPQMKGVMKVTHRKKLLIAIPTTAGTGSEATVAAVITNPATHEKYAINDPKLIPEYAILDPNFLLKLPGKVTSTTGMDALTHAVEAYTNHFQTKKTRAMSRKAVKLIFSDLELTYREPENLQARENMQLAAYYAGVAFTRGYVGNVHAMAHTLGGFYNTPHGLANAVILPHVLRYYGKHAYRRLAQLADLVNLPNRGKTNKSKAEAFINEIDAMNKRMDIPVVFHDLIQNKDIPLMVKRALHEANPLYPVPVIFSAKDFTHLYHEINP